MRYELPDGAWLTPREVTIALAMATGEPLKIVAYNMGLTPGTVKVYLSVIYAKLFGQGEGNKTKLALWAAARIAELRSVL